MLSQKSLSPDFLRELCNRTPCIRNSTCKQKEGVCFCVSIGMCMCVVASLCRLRATSPPCPSVRGCTSNFLGAHTSFPELDNGYYFFVLILCSVFEPSQSLIGARANIRGESRWAKCSIPIGVPDFSILRGYRKPPLGPSVSIIKSMPLGTMPTNCNGTYAAAFLFLDGSAVLVFRAGRSWLAFYAPVCRTCHCQNIAKIWSIVQNQSANDDKGSK